MKIACGQVGQTKCSTYSNSKFHPKVALDYSFKYQLHTDSMIDFQSFPWLFATRQIDKDLHKVVVTIKVIVRLLL